MTARLLTADGLWETLAQIATTLLIAIVVQETGIFDGCRGGRMPSFLSVGLKWQTETRLAAMEDELRAPPRAATPADELTLELREHSEGLGDALMHARLGLSHAFEGIARIALVGSDAGAALSPNLRMGDEFTREGRSLPP